jgi:hypothetical protein
MKYDLKIFNIISIYNLDFLLIPLRIDELLKWSEVAPAGRKSN